MNELDQPITPRPSRGRPANPVPPGRDLVAEVAHLAAWMAERPALKPATISKAAGLHREAFGNILRSYRSPQVDALNAIYEALKPYQYESIANTNKNN